MPLGYPNPYASEEVGAFDERGIHVGTRWKKKKGGRRLTGKGNSGIRGTLNG
jgi:hypothetical protein